MVKSYECGQLDALNRVPKSNIIKNVDANTGIYLLVAFVVQALLTIFLMRVVWFWLGIAMLVILLPLNVFVLKELQDFNIKQGFGAINSWISYQLYQKKEIRKAPGERLLSGKRTIND
jgi:hypothetical protein